MHKAISPEGVGEGLKTKINVNLGISKDCTDYSIEWEKVKMARKVDRLSAEDYINSIFTNS